MTNNTTPITQVNDTKKTDSGVSNKRPQSATSPVQQGQYLSALEQAARQEQKKQSTKKSIFQMANKNDSSKMEEGEEDGSMAANGSMQSHAAQSLTTDNDEDASSQHHSNNGSAIESLSSKKEGKAPDATAFSSLPNQLQPSLQSTQVSPSQTQTPVHRTSFFALAEQMASSITSMLDQHQSTTTVTLQQPPLFAGASFTVIANATAPKQFNISFQNLSPDARRLIEVQASQQQLQTTLSQHGYTVHIVTIESPHAIESPILPPEKSDSHYHQADQETDSRKKEQ